MYDYIILGGGPAGLVAAKVARGLGKSVLIIEKTDRLGGECTWTGCVPSKALIHIADLYRSAKQMKPFGISISSIDSTKVMEYVHKKRREVYQTHTPEELKKEGVAVLSGTPKFINKDCIEVNNQQIKGTKILIATGSLPFIPPIEGIKTVDYLTNETLFELTKLPASMAILGGGPIGVEMACALHTLGVKITVIEMSEHILAKEDPELTAMLEQDMKEKGIALKTNSKLIKVAPDGNKVLCVIEHKGEKHELISDQLLVATGRKPNVAGLNLQEIGVKTTKKGIEVDNTLQTSISSIYACGDVVGPYQFSHMAEYQASLATQNAFIPFIKKHIDYTHRIWVTFSDPEFASAGMTETQARDKYGDKIAVYRISYDSIDRAKIDENTLGMCKIICNTKGRILGAHILGANAGELIHEIQLGKYYDRTIYDFYKPIHAYPTYSELIWHMAKRAYVQKLKKNPILRFFAGIFGLKK